jgi:hypothetical protein
MGRGGWFENLGAETEVRERERERERQRERERVALMCNGEIVVVEFGAWIRD